MSTLSPYFNQSHKQLRLEIREFLAKHVSGNLEQWEKDTQLPKSLWKKLGEQGYLGLLLPTEQGGGGLDIFSSVVLLEELSRLGCAGFRVSVAVHSYMTLPYLLKSRFNEVRKNYLEPAIEGKKVAALALTEAQAGTDLSGLTLAATEQKDHYVFNGAKKFVANGTTCDFYVVAARTSPSTNSRFGATGLTLFVVDADSEGIRKEKLSTVGWRSADVAALSFNQVKVPKRHILGRAGTGFKLIMQGIQLERIVASILAIGGTDQCLQMTWQYLAERNVGGKPLNQLSTVRHTMAELEAAQAMIRQFAYHTAWLYDQGELPMKECTMLKFQATDFAKKAAMECAQLHGAAGYLSDHPIARIVRDAQATTIAGGVNEAMKDLIAQMSINGQ